MQYEHIDLIFEDGTQNLPSQAEAFDFLRASITATIVIGAHRDDNENGKYSGSAYIYILSGTVWTEQAKLIASDGVADDEFGGSVAAAAGLQEEDLLGILLKDAYGKANAIVFDSDDVNARINIGGTIDLVVIRRHETEGL